jgi:hypothetical protein
MKKKNVTRAAIIESTFKGGVERMICKNKELKGKDGFHLGFRCVCVAIDLDRSDVTFKHSAGTETFVIPLFGPKVNEVETIGINVGDEFWFQVQRSKRAETPKKKSVPAKKKRPRKKVTKR